MKNYFKAFAFLLTFILLTNCEKGEILTPLPINKTARFQVVPNSTLIKSNAIVNTLKTFNSTTQNTTNKSGDIILSETYNFAIDTEYALLRTVGHNKTYTFKVLRENPLENTLENLVIHIDTVSNETKRFLMKYPIINDDYDYENIIIEEIYDESLTYSKSSIFDEVCYLTQDYQVSSTDYSCVSGQHLGTSQAGICDYEGTVYQPYTITSGFWISMEYCDRIGESGEIIVGDSSNPGEGGNSSGTGNYDDDIVPILMNQ